MLICIYIILLNLINANNQAVISLYSHHHGDSCNTGVLSHQVPKDRYHVPSTFPHVVMELSNQEIKAYFTPRDFHIGDTVSIYNRRFLIYDVDDFTKAFYWKNFGVTDFDPVNVDQPANPNAKMVCIYMQMVDSW